MLTSVFHDLPVSFYRFSDFRIVVGKDQVAIPEKKIDVVWGDNSSG